MAVRAHQETTSTPGYEHGDVMRRDANTRLGTRQCPLPKWKAYLRISRRGYRPGQLRAQLERDQKEGYTTEDLVALSPGPVGLTGAASGVGDGGRQASLAGNRANRTAVSFPVKNQPVSDGQRRHADSFSQKKSERESWQCSHETPFRTNRAADAWSHIKIQTEGKLWCFGIPTAKHFFLVGSCRGHRGQNLLAHRWHAIGWHSFSVACGGLQALLHDKRNV